MSAPAVDLRSHYVSAVATELHDLAPADRAELIEELDDHIAALLADRPDADLVGELGEPRAYASELRLAAGLTGAPPAVQPAIKIRLARLSAELERHIPDWLRKLAPDLRNVWWVLRGYLVAVIIASRFSGTNDGGLNVAWPAFTSHRWMGALFVLAVVVASVHLGRRRTSSVAARRTIIAANAVIVLAALITYNGFTNNGYAYGGGVSNVDTQYVPNCPQQVSNFFPYDASGKPLTGVRIYDQYGTPVDLTRFGCTAGDPSFDYSQPNVYPYPTAVVPTAADGPGSGVSRPPASLAPLASVAPTPSAGATSAGPAG